jgi:transposase
MACDEEKAERFFLDDRHGHPSKLTQPVQTWLSEFCATNPQIASSRIQTELKTEFGTAVSISQINRVRAKLGVSKPASGSALVPSKKN